MSARKPGKHAFFFIFITVLIDMIGFGLIIPVMPDLIEELTGLQANRAVVLGAWLMSSYAAMQFFFAPIIGGLSDRFGRKRVLLAALGGFTIDYMIMGFAPHFWLLLVGRILAGIFGASYSTANAFIADITPPEERAGRFGMIGAAFGIGFILGPAIGGFLGDAFGPRAPFFAAAALAGANFVYGLVILPESSKPENRRPFYPAIWTYYSDYKFGWDAAERGLSLMAVGISTAIVQGGLTRILVPKLGEWRAITLSLTLGSLGYLGFGLATEGWMVYAVIAFGALGGIGQPALQGVMSRIVPANAQGELQGAMTSLQSLSMILGPLTMSRVFAHFSREDSTITFVGAPFAMAAVLTVIALLIALAAKKYDPGPTRTYPASTGAANAE